MTMQSPNTTTDSSMTTMNTSLKIQLDDSWDNISIDEDFYDSVTQSSSNCEYNDSDVFEAKVDEYKHLAHKDSLLVANVHYQQHGKESLKKKDSLNHRDSIIVRHNTFERIKSNKSKEDSEESDEEDHFRCPKTDNSREDDIDNPSIDPRVLIHRDSLVVRKMSYEHHCKEHLKDRDGGNLTEVIEDDTPTIDPNALGYRDSIVVRNISYEPHRNLRHRKGTNAVENSEESNVESSSPNYRDSILVRKETYEHHCKEHLKDRHIFEKHNSNDTIDIDSIDSKLCAPGDSIIKVL